MAPDAAIWYGFAGTTRDRIPPPGSIVYYFAEGHAKQSRAELPEKPYFLCKVISATLGYENDYPLVTFLLIPVDEAAAEAASLAAAAVAADKPPERKISEVVSFTMVVKPDDLDGGALIIPDECAETIFSTFKVVEGQFIGLHDLGRNPPWSVRYTKVRSKHSFTLGWPAFAWAKNLELGDTIEFVKKAMATSPNIHIGVRKPRLDGSINEEHVVAIREAGGGRRFQVRYFPLAAPVPFVVPATLVSAFSEFNWSRGIMKWFNIPVDETRGTDLLNLELGVAVGSQRGADETRGTDLLNLELGVAVGSSSKRRADELTEGGAAGGSSSQRGADEPEGGPASKRGKQGEIMRLFGIDIHKGGDDEQDGK